LISTYFDINNVQQLENAKQIALASTKAVQKQEQPKEINDDATKVEVSENTSTVIDSTISAEELLVKKINSAQTIYDSLSNIRLELADLIEQLRNPDIKHTIESLSEIDSKSNVLIDKVVDVIKNNDTFGLINFSSLNLYYEGLNSLKLLDINDEKYLNKVENIIKKVSEKANKYQNIEGELYSIIEESNKKYENLINNNIEKNSGNLQNEIFNDPQKTLESVCAKLTPEIVMRLLNP